MCLSIVVDRPHHVLNRGEHRGFQWVVTSNGIGYRCGYVRVPLGHPWHGKGYEDIPDVSVHGGLTFAEADVDCGKGEPDNAWWVGFDFGHGGDEPDPALMDERIDSEASVFLDVANSIDSLLRGRYPGSRLWTQGEAEAECKDLCEQAFASRDALG